jgi:DNA replication protein DnaC
MIYNKVINNLEKLKLDKMSTYLSTYLDEINKNEISFLDALYYLTEKEIEFKAQRASEFNIRVAGFPFIRTIDEFDFGFQPSINKKEILDLATLRFIEEKKNVLMLGSSGVGKTHIATSIGVEAAKKRISTYFITCHDLISRLTLAHKENRFNDSLKTFNKYKLLIIDEIGYLPVDKNGANLLFQLIAKRYERSSTIITTNQPFSKWGEVFSDNILANAILDRLLHHSHIINITGKSYRIKDISLTDNDDYD